MVLPKIEIKCDTRQTYNCFKQKSHHRSEIWYMSTPLFKTAHFHCSVFSAMNEVKILSWS